MDPLTIGAAYLTAQTAVKGIKEAIKLGKEIGEIAHDVNQFFRSQATIDRAAREKSEQIREAVKDPKKKQSYYELTAHAMEIAIKQEEMQRYEKEIRDTLIWSGNGHIYRRMCSERERMIREQEQAESTQKIMESRQKQLDDIDKEQMKDILICVAIAIVLGLSFYLLVDWMIAEGIVLTASGKSGKR
jgi:ABC-type multidrug transport system fused ATPase/permease subunit